ncbi:MAG: HNH endonuclease [Rhodospirillales bacterium]|nr:HNH endonuclease [Rhodospirillales bacterium]
MYRPKIAKISARSFRKEKYSTKPSSNLDWYTARAKRLKLDNFACQKCGSQDKIEVHHIISVSRGGNHSLSNLITLCHKHHDKQHRHHIRRKK